MVGRAVDRSSADWPGPRERCGFGMGIGGDRLGDHVSGLSIRICLVNTFKMESEVRKVICFYIGSRSAVYWSSSWFVIDFTFYFKKA